MIKNSKSLIPNTFDLGGITYTIEYVDCIREGKLNGMIHFDLSKILIANKVPLNSNIETVSTDAKNQIFFHELVHGILVFIMIMVR